MTNYGEINNYKHKKGVRENEPNYGDEELKFVLWKAELNKELLTFWKKMIK